MPYLIPHRTIKLYGWRARLGIVLASPNAVFEAEAFKLVPEGVSCHYTRLPYREISGKGKAEMVSIASETALLLSGGTNAVGVDIVCFTHAGASMSAGIEGDKRLVKEMQEVTGVKATTTASCVTRAIKHLKAHHIAVMIPYNSIEAFAPVQRYLEASGLEVVTLKNGGFNTAAQVSSQLPEVTYRMLRDMDTPKVEAFLMAVPNMRTIEIIDKLERETGKPVVTGTIATIWNCLRELDIKDGIEGYGRLLES